MPNVDYLFGYKFAATFCNAPNIRFYPLGDRFIH